MPKNKCQYHEIDLSEICTKPTNLELTSTPLKSVRLTRRKINHLIRPDALRTMLMDRCEWLDYSTFIKTIIRKMCCSTSKQQQQTIYIFVSLGGLRIKNNNPPYAQPPKHSRILVRTLRVKRSQAMYAVKRNTRLCQIYAVKRPPKTCNDVRKRPGVRKLTLFDTKDI